MPMNYRMFKKRADEDPEASQKTGLAKVMAGWKLMLGDDRRALNGTGEDRKKFWAQRQKDLNEGP